MVIPVHIFSLLNKHRLVEPQLSHRRGRHEPSMYHAMSHTERILLLINLSVLQPRQ